MKKNVMRWRIEFAACGLALKRRLASAFAASREIDLCKCPNVDIADMVLAYNHYHDHEFSRY